MKFCCFSLFTQIGNRFALTAAHCLYDDDNGEVLPASSFSIMLGLHDRRKTKEPNRCLYHHKVNICISLSCTRRQIRVSKVLLHENFTDSVNDIAILQLGKKNLVGDPLHTYSQKIVWISQTSTLPVFLTLEKDFLTRMGTSTVCIVNLQYD